jgi:hypothetical protein
VGLRPGIVHRLDKEDLRLMVVAENDIAHQRLIPPIPNRSGDQGISGSGLGTSLKKSGTN